MTLINCQECGEQISDKADACIKCGAPTKDTSKQILEELKKHAAITKKDILCLDCGYNGKMGLSEWRTWWGKTYLAISIPLSLFPILIFGISIWSGVFASLILFGGFTTGKKANFYCPQCKKTLQPR